MADPEVTKEIIEEVKEFPRDYTKCPNCGSEKRIAQTVVDELIEAGKAKADMKAWIATHQSLIVDPTRGWLSAPLLTAMLGVCYDCGTVYCIHVERTLATPQLQK